MLINLLKDGDDIKLDAQPGKSGRALRAERQSAMRDQVKRNSKLSH